MDNLSLSQLIEVSRAAGANPAWVQAGGGNTSAKSADGRTMAVKASGTALALMSETAGWVELDLARLLAIFDRADLAGMKTPAREAAVVEHLAAAAIGRAPGRPSVESALHAVLGRVVIHTHPVAVNALTCGPGQSALAEMARANEPPPLWVPYTDPGYKLAGAVRAAAEAYAKKHGARPAVLFLENHGIFVSAETAKEALALHADWVGRCEKFFAGNAPALAAPPAPDPAALRRALLELRRAWTEARGAPAFVRFSDDAELRGAAVSDATAATLSAGALTPDHVVYAGFRAVLAGSFAELPGKVRAELSRPACPRVALVRGAGAFVLEGSAARLAAAEALGASAAQIVRLAAGRGGARNLSPAAAEFIVNWEAEHYRARAGDRPALPLSGKVALVTGAASGLGLGIAGGLVEAGAAVAFADVDEAGLASAAAALGEPERVLPLGMDVTGEASVIAGCDRVLARWGGLDVVVCAAGIAPPFELVDMPADQWRRALEINLTGYFLVAREAARIMKAQGTGGAMVMVSSKTGLEASRANSAYNATKAGELHLMRGWALELGSEGIRVNAVAPGNVFEGSKIWNPEYVRACARKRGLRPEEVIPYYNSLTALGREIKRADVAAAVVFLCSEAARCITGQTLVIDSGQVMVR